MALKWNGRVVAQQTKAAALDGMVNATEALLAKSNARVPFQEGGLKDSGKASQDYDANGVSGAVSYNTPYARRQHEEVGYAHPLGGEAKYLENATHDFAGEYAQIIGQAIRSAHGG